MEQRLQRAFQDAERKVLNTSNNLTVQVQLCVLCQCLVPNSLGLYFAMCVLVFQHNVFDSHYGNKFMFSSELRLFYVLQKSI